MIFDQMIFPTTKKKKLKFRNVLHFQNKFDKNEFDV